jgi:hypothetical protein
MNINVWEPRAEEAWTEAWNIMYYNMDHVPIMLILRKKKYRRASFRSKVADLRDTASSVDDQLEYVMKYPDEYTNISISNIRLYRFEIEQALLTPMLRFALSIY